MPKKGAKKWRKKIIFVLNKYLSVTHVSTWIFQGLYIIIVFRSIALVTKKLWAIIVSFHRQDFFFALYYKKKFLRKIL